MPNTQVNNWYTTFARKNLRDELGIDPLRKRDMNRLLVPKEDGSGMRPLFENGFEATPEQKEQLYNHAKNGELFAISRRDNEAYQIAEDRIRSVADMVQQEQSRISMGRRIAYQASKVITGPTGLGLRVGKNLISLVTFGLLDTPLNWVYDGLATGFNLFMEGVFSIKQMEEENKYRMTLGDRFANFLSFGKAREEKAKQVQTHDRLTQACVRAKSHLDKSISEIELADQLAANVKNVDENAERERMRQEAEARLREVRNLNNPQVINNDPQQNPQQQQQPNPEQQQQPDPLENQNHDEHVQEPEPEQVQEEQVQEEQVQAQEQGNNPNNGDDRPNQKDGKEMKSQFLQLCEDMLQYFGAKDGLRNAALTAQNMNQLLVNLKADPNRMAESGMRDKDIQRLSNMCTNFTSIYEKGMDATRQLLNPAQSAALSPDKRADLATDMLVMHMCEYAMVNAAMNARVEGAKMKPHHMLRHMMKNPEVFQNGLRNMVGAMNIARSLAEQSPEDLAVSAGNPAVLRAALAGNVREMAKQSRIAQEHQNEVQRHQEQQRQNDMENQPRAVGS